MIRILVPVALLVAAGAAGGRAPPDLGALALDRESPRIEAIVAGVPLHLAVLPGDGLELAASAAVRLPAVAWVATTPIEVGRVAVPVREATVPVTIGGVALSMRATTQALPCCRGLDGAIGAADLPWSVVRIGDGAGLAERRFPAARDDHDDFDLPWRIGKDTLRLQLAPDNPETLATASAAAVLARAYGGRLQDAVRTAPVVYGIERPVRDMVFDRPVPILGFTVTRIAVRIADFAGDSRLLAALDADRAAETAGDIVVKHHPVPPQHRWPGVTIGRDLLGRCPGIAVYRDRAVGLACRG